MLLCCAEGRGQCCSPHWSPPKACGSQVVVRRPQQETQARIGRLLVPWVWSPRGRPWQDDPVPCGGFWLHCRTGHRGLQSMTEELGFRAPHKWECLTVFRWSTAGFSSPTTSIFRWKIPTKTMSKLVLETSCVEFQLKGSIFDQHG